MAFSELIQSSAKLVDISKVLDALPHEVRLSECRKLSAKDIKALYWLAEGKSCSVDKDFVPASKGKLKEVRHFGKNTLPFFSLFEKPMCRPKKSSAKEVVASGFNRQKMQAITGPGYFVAHDAKHENGKKTVVIDYYEVPTEKCENWPEIKSNENGLDKIVYGHMHDWMWKVSQHVNVGRVQKKGKWTENYFILCREP